MLDFRRTDAVRQRTRSPMGGGMGVATDHGHPGQHRALLGTHNMDNPLPHIVQRDLHHVEGLAIFIEGLQLNTGDGVRQRVQARLALTLERRHIMIRHREVGATPPQVPVGKGETLKGLGRCHLV